MGRLIALDFGMRRVGIAHSDDMKIIASPLTTLSPEETPAFLAQYHQDNGIETIVVGKPAHLHSAQAHVDVENDIKAFIAYLEKALPGVPVERFDERFTSKIASAALYASGVPKSKRREKGALDMTSAAVILQDYMRWKENT